MKHRERQLQLDWGGRGGYDLRNMMNEASRSLTTVEM
jgi:hypothetical protein